MRVVLLFILLAAIQKTSIAQYDNTNKKDSGWILNAKCLFFNLEAKSESTSEVQLPFDHLSFIDVRYDTSFVALNWNVPLFQFSKAINRKFNLYGGLASNLNHYFNNYYSTGKQSVQNQLVCYIKKFSITPRYELLEHFNAGFELLNESNYNNINLEVECYYRVADTLYPAARIDTSYSVTFHFGKLFTTAVKEMLQPIMYKIEHINVDNIVKRKQYNNHQITDRYAERFNVPALTIKSFKKGVYKTFKEFMNNEPSIDSFSLSTDKLKYNAANVGQIDVTSLSKKAIQKRNTVIFLYDTNGELINPSNVFGYSDGTTFWIQHGAFFFPLVKMGNCFEFMYIHHYADSDKNTQVLYILTPLNMETGLSN